jgi:DNA replication protein DnaC
MINRIGDITKAQPPSRKKRLVVFSEVKTLGRFHTGVPRDLNEVDRAVRRQMRPVLMGESKWPIYLYGPTGVGKTCCVLALTDRVNRCWYTDIHDLPPYWQRDHSDWREIRRRNLVVIDDIGRSGNDVEYEQILQVCRWRECKPTIFVSNHDPAKIDELFDRRIWDRLCKGTVIHYSGKSKR